MALGSSAKIWSQLAKLYVHPSCRGEYCISIQSGLARIVNILTISENEKGAKMEVSAIVIVFLSGICPKVLNSGKKLELYMSVVICPIKARIILS